jgi:type I restriction enzyme M protein
MNLAIRGIEGNIGDRNADSFTSNLHPDLKADYILANPPFNISDWWNNKLAEDVRWQYGTPPKGNANYGWVQHMVHHLAPNGMAGFVLANGSMSSNQSGEGEIRKALVADDRVDCMIALPGQLFYTTQIPACLWFLVRDKSGKPTAGHEPCRDRQGETLFIDARKLGVLMDRTHRELPEGEVARIAGTYHAWRGEPGAGAYADVAGFCKSATLEEIASHSYVLTPGRYVGAAELEEDDEPFEEKMARLTKTLEAQFAESAKLEAAIRENLRGLGL